MPYFNNDNNVDLSNYKTLRKGGGQNFILEEYDRKKKNKIYFVVIAACALAGTILWGIFWEQNINLPKETSTDVVPAN